MPEPHWTSYVGMATGVVGALAGITGGILAVVSYRRVNKIKALDLRLELKKIWLEVDRTASGLESHLARVDNSHRRVMVMLGQAKSGAWHVWAGEYAADKAKVKELIESSPSMPEAIDNFDLASLERLYVDMLRYRGAIHAMSEKYAKVWESDEELRRERRQDMKNMVGRT